MVGTRLVRFEVWVHMVLHFPHVEGDFGVASNNITKDVVFYTAEMGHLKEKLGKRRLPGTTDQQNHIPMVGNL